MMSRIEPEPHTTSMLTPGLTVTTAWSLGYLALLTSTGTGFGSWGIGVLGGLGVGLVGTLLSRALVGRDVWGAARTLPLATIGLLPPATAGFFVILAKRQPTTEPGVDQSNAEALATAIGNGMGEAIFSGVMMTLGFAAGILLALTIAWFLWNRSTPTLVPQQRVLVSAAWLVACSVGVAVLLYLPE